MVCKSSDRGLWVMGVKPESGREVLLRSYLETGGYNCCLGQLDDLAESRPLGIVLDISPFSDDGWGLLLKIKENPATRNIPVLPIFLSESGAVGGVFPVAGFFTLPLDETHLLDRLAIYGLTEEAETWDLEALIVSRNGEEKLAKTVEKIGFEAVMAYNGKEALALTSIKPKYLAFCAMMLADMSAFEFLEKLRLYPYSGNMPVFVLLKSEMKDGEKTAMSRDIAHLVRKKELSCEEFLSHLRRRD
ncbi:response regulator [Pelotalea chapellei]|uniref:Response regulator n=1 Tax=Pelotalea chapellei TaxID=44671 RepID=A0ABS5U4R1_9BACT|nr:response regulator [Pelotalea chapellei]MBT1070652.1 response regulator [Pelotalea chapellei]